ncbi:DUF362 domain-containing protein [Thermodesulfobacteriota bacterium]
MDESNKERKTPVSKVLVKNGLEESIEKAVELIGGMQNIISPDEKILVIGNFNSSDRYPASSDSRFLRALVRILQSHGTRNITLGASCGLAWQPTREVLKKKKAYKLAEELGIELINFDEGEWVKIDIKGNYFKSVSISETAVDADRVIYVPNAKTHSLARFSMSLKFAVGLMEPQSRRELHNDHLEEKVVEVNLALRPDLIIMDARKCLVTGGPAKGRRKKAGFVLASKDQVAMDMEGLKILKSFKAKNRLDMPLWELPQMAAAQRLGIGISGDDDYLVVEG